MPHVNILDNNTTGVHLSDNAVQSGAAQGSVLARVSRDSVIHQPVVPTSSPTGLPMNSPRTASSLKRSLLFTIGGLCSGILSGVAVTMLLWNGLKERFSEGVDATASGDVSASGTINADGNFEAGGRAEFDDIDAEVIGFGFGVPASGAADFDVDGELNFDGALDATDLDIGFNGNASIDIGDGAPTKVILSVAAVFGIVVATVAWICERQITHGENQTRVLDDLAIIRTQTQARQAPEVTDVDSPSLLPASSTS